MVTVWKLGTVTLQAVSTVSIRTNANIVQFALPNITPGTAADEVAQIFDTLGAASVLTVTGTFANSDINTAKEQFDELVALINGNQSAIILSNKDSITGLPVLFDDQSVMIAASQVNWADAGNKSDWVLTLLKGIRA